jgi:acyl-coenzyme A thioesterase PaaI-like protein
MVIKEKKMNRIKDMTDMVVPYIKKPVQDTFKKTVKRIPVVTQSTWLLRAFGFYKIPLLAFTWPKVLQLDKQKSILKIPLTYRTKNHLNVMYFGALNIGAEVVIALHVIQEIESTGEQIDFLFKDFKANFLKRAESDVQFICEEGESIRNLINQAAQSVERQNATFKCYAITPDKTGEEKVAEFELTLSVKKRKNKESEKSN